MTKSRNDEEWFSKSVHYWTVIRIDRNNNGKNGADQYVAEVVNARTDDGCTCGETGAAMGGKIGAIYRAKLFQTAPLVKMVGLMIPSNVPARADKVIK
jgi:hypothetical protein